MTIPKILKAEMDEACLIVQLTSAGYVVTAIGDPEKFADTSKPIMINVNPNALRVEVVEPGVTVNVRTVKSAEPLRSTLSNYSKMAEGILIGAFATAGVSQLVRERIAEISKPISLEESNDVQD